VEVRIAVLKRLLAQERKKAGGMLTRDPMWGVEVSNKSENKKTDKGNGRAKLAQTPIIIGRIESCKCERVFRGRHHPALRSKKKRPLNKGRWGKENGPIRTHRKQKREDPPGAET